MVVIFSHLLNLKIFRQPSCPHFCALCPVSIAIPLHPLLVSVAEQTTLSVKSVAKGNRRRDRTKVDLKVERHVGAGVVVRLDRTADLMVSDLGVDLLPLPEDVVDHGVVHVEKGFWSDSQQKWFARVERAVLINSPPGLLAAFPAWPSMPPMPKWPPAWIAGGNQSGSPSICLSKLAKSGWSSTFWTSIGLASLCKIAGCMISEQSFLSKHAHVVD